MQAASAVRAIRGIVAVLATTAAGVAVFSGSGQPVTARSYPHWQELPTPPMTTRTHALGIRIGPRVLVLGGSRPDGSAARDGAAYDLRTGSWRHRRTPVAVSDRDAAVVAAGVVLLRHVDSARATSWWRYDVRLDAWSRLYDLPPHLHAPSAFGSEVYALSGRRVVVYSVQLDRWTRLPADPLRPPLADAAVTASREGTVVTGHTTGGGRLVADRWDGLRWHRVRASRHRPVESPPDGSTWVEVGGRTFVVRDGRAWIRLP